MGNGVPQKSDQKPPALKDTLFDRIEEFARVLPERIDPERFLRVGLTTIVHNPKLKNCTAESIYLALLDSARTGLLPDGTEAALIPYGDTCEFQEMWQGLARLMMRHGNARKVEARVVKDGDDFDYHYGLDPDLRHKPKPGGGSDRETTHAYAIAWLDNEERIFDVMDREELDRVQAQAEASKKSPAWQNWPDEMRRKSVVKRLAKYLDLAPEAQAAIDLDDAQGHGTPREEAAARGRSKSLAEEALEGHADATAESLRHRLAGAGEKEEEPDDGDFSEDALLGEDAPDLSGEDDPDDLPWKPLESAPEGWEIAHRGAGKYLLRNPDGTIVNDPDTLLTEPEALAKVRELRAEEEETIEELREQLNEIRQDRGWTWADVGERAQDVLDLEEPKGLIEFTRGELTILVQKLQPVNEE